MTSTFFNPSKLFGKNPVKELKLTSNTELLASFPISSGRHPAILLLDKINSFNVSIISPIVFGIHPLNLLFARSTTETFEFPIFSGIIPENLLWLRNSASNSFSNISGGRFPSKSLNLMSKNFSNGIPRTAIGNSPTNMLLLMSNSWRIVNLDILLGIIPQNRFEFI